MMITICMSSKSSFSVNAEIIMLLYWKQQSYDHGSNKWSVIFTLLCSSCSLPPCTHQTGAWCFGTGHFLFSPTSSQFPRCSKNPSQDSHCQSHDLISFSGAVFSPCECSAVEETSVFVFLPFPLQYLTVILTWNVKGKTIFCKYLLRLYVMPVSGVFCNYNFYDIFWSKNLSLKISLSLLTNVS